MRVMNRDLSGWIVAHPRIIIIAVFIATVAGALALRRGIELDVSPLSLVERGGQARQDYEDARRDFGDDKYLVLAVTVDDVFDPGTLARLRFLDAAIGREPGVAEILSLFNVPYARSTPDGASLERLIPEGGPSPERIEEARRAATSDGLYVGNLISKDARTAAWNILIDERLSTNARHDVTRRIYNLAHGAQPGEVYFAGDPFSQWRATEAIRKDLLLFLPITVLLIAVLLWRAFRSWVAVLLPLVTIVIGLVWLVGAMAALGVHPTILALMLPTLLLAIGCSYLIHVLNQIGLEHERRAGECDSREALAAALRFISVPVIVSAFTIIAGFLALSLTHIPAVRETSLFAALGAGFTMILSLTFVPAALAAAGIRRCRFATRLDGHLARSIVRAGKWATTREMWLYAATALLVVFSLTGMVRIVIDIDYFRFFRPGSETSTGLAEINRRLSGVVNFDLIIESDAPGVIETPSALRRIEQLQREAESVGTGVDRTLSVVDFVRHAHRAFRGGDVRYDTVPEDPAIISDLLLDRDRLTGFLTQDGKRARVLIRTKQSGSQAMASVVEDLERRARTLLPELRVNATGTIVLMNQTSDRIGREQVQAVTIALLTIYLMLSALFRSLRVGLTALVPNLVPVLFFFGFMGWSGITLNLTTSLVACVVLGLAVDNSVQFIVRFRHVLDECPSVRDAILLSLRLSGRPIIYANVALAATFAIFSLSNFAPIASFGLLSAVTILGCLVEDMVLLPARLTSPVFQAKKRETAESAE